MDVVIRKPAENIREIEDIIDIQKARGSFGKQVAFNLPSDCESTVSANIAKSLESGLSSTKSERLQKKKVRRCKRYKTPLPDVISWPSDSDITVLRMKLCLTQSELKKKVRNGIPGDGLHQPDSSSMVNLATLIDEPQPPSKQSITIEEYLLPLSSWEREQDDESTEPKIAQDILDSDLPKLDEVENYPINDHHEFNDYEYELQSDKKSKIARFLRLYFCPCCTCLYKMETMSDDPSAYWTKRKDITV